MNKYIRTKDGNIYQVYDKVFDYKNDKRYQLVDGRFEVNLNDIVKQADTIEELCDEFVWVSANNEYHNRKANEYGLRTSEMQLGCPQLKEIYGAIWTDKGLIYVAKMNNEGKLKLL